MRINGILTEWFNNEQEVRQRILMVECVDSIRNMLGVDGNGNVHMLWQVSIAIIFSENLIDFQ